MAVSRAVCEIFSVKEWRDVEDWVRGCSRSLKMAPFESFVYCFIFAYHSNYGSFIISEILYNKFLLNTTDCDIPINRFYVRRIYCILNCTN